MMDYLRPDKPTAYTHSRSMRQISERFDLRLDKSRVPKNIVIARLTSQT
jgi:hypothetical protein